MSGSIRFCNIRGDGSIVSKALVLLLAVKGFELLAYEHWLEGAGCPSCMRQGMAARRAANNAEKKARLDKSLDGQIISLSLPGVVQTFAAI